MNSARIAELLQPFLCAPVAAPGNSRLSDSNASETPETRHSGAPDICPSEAAEVCSSNTSDACHSEPATAGEESAVLSPAQLDSISMYIDILIRWNARINLTAIRDPEEIVTRHFGESLFAARHLFPHNTHVGNAYVGTAAQACPERGRRGCPAQRSSAALAVADIGSGAGFPGLPFKLWAPHIGLTLIESNHKKAAFLREVTRALTLTDVNIQNARAETLAGRTFNVVTLRAVERFESILPIAGALVAPAGRLVLLISASQQGQAHSSLPQFTWPEVVPVPSSRARILLIGQQTGTSLVTSGI
jgi:16S rRNA (guanine527-N7)-methyltransferase